MKGIGRYLFFLLLSMTLVLVQCGKNEENTQTNDEDDYLTEEEAAIIDQLPDGPAMDSSSVILPNGETVATFLWMYDSVLNNLGGKLSPNNYVDEWVLEYWIRVEMYQEAIFLVNRVKHQYPNEGSDKPKQNGLAYGWGNKNHKVRRSPSLSKSICTHKIYGLDCSGFVSQVYSGAGINTNESYNAETLRKGVVLQDALWESFPDLKNWKFIDYGKLAANDLKSGDIVYWLSQNKSGKMYASHIGLVFMHKEKNTDEKQLVVFQSNGTPDGCVLNLQTTRGPRKIELTDNYWFGSKKQYGITRLVSPLSLVKTKPVVSNQKFSKNGRLTITTGGDIMDAGGSSIMTKGVCWSTHYPPTVEHSKTNEGSGFESYFSNISGLEPYTTYYIRAYTKNGDGYSYGNLITYKTGGPGGTNGEPCPGTPTVTDVDGNVYNTVMIGDQCWMKENLNVGIMISGYSEQSNNAIIEKYCPDDEIANCAKYGGLYQWDEMMRYETNNGAQGICPSGWHIPSDDEWKVLEGNLDSLYNVGHYIWDNIGDRGYNVGLNMKAQSGWNHNGNGMDLFGFSALPGGYRFPHGAISFMGDGGYWWSSTDSSFSAWMRYVSYHDRTSKRNSDSKTYGFSVRCVKNKNL